jgi:hypothetical protein
MDCAQTQEMRDALSTPVVLVETPTPLPSVRGKLFIFLIMLFCYCGLKIKKYLIYEIACWKYLCM